MNRRWQSRISFLFLGAATLATIATWSVAGQSVPSMTELVRETQKQSEAPGKITLVWWLPEEFWAVSFRQGGGLSDEQQEAFLQSVRPYLIVAAVDGNIGPMGGTDFVGKESLQANIKVIDNNGKSYLPMPEDQLTGDVKNLSALMRSMFGNMLGAMGQGMHIFFFPASTAGGTAIAAATKEGMFSVEVGGQSFTWHLPIGSVLPAKACPVDGERMSGAWKYCPWHGKHLEDADEQTKREAKP